MPMISLLPPSIVSLLFWGLPSTIARFIVAVVVFPPEGMDGTRRMPQVGKKVDEIKPAFAYRDSATAVVRIFGVFRV